MQAENSNNKRKAKRVLKMKTKIVKTLCQQKEVLTL